MRDAPPYVPGIRRVAARDLEVRVSAGHEHFYAINLEELSEEVALGLPKSGDTQTFRAEWTDKDLGGAFLTGGAAPGDDEELALDFFDIVRGVTFNDLAFAQARFNDDRGTGFTSARTDTDGNIAGPTVLYIPERDVRDSRLRLLYRDLMAARGYIVEVDKSRAEVLKRLDWMIRQARYVEEANDEVEKGTKPIRRALAQVQSAQLCMQAMFDFAKGPAHRRRVWGSHEPKADPEFLDFGNLLREPPSETQKSNAEGLANDNLAVLAAHLTETLVWMTTGGEPKEESKDEPPVDERNRRARKVLDLLREDELLGDLLDNAHVLDRHVWGRVVQLLTDAVRAISTSPHVYPDLLRSEIMAIARTCAAEVEVPEPSWTIGRLHQVAQSIHALVPDIDLVEEETVLGKRLQALVTARKFKKHATSVSETLLVRAMPGLFRTITERAEQRLAGEVAKRAKAEAIGQAAVFRTLVGASNMSGENAKKAFEGVADVVKGGPAKVGPLISEQGVLRDAKLSLASDLAWNALQQGLAVFALRELVEDKNKAPAVKQLEVIKGVLDCLEPVKELAELIGKSPAVMWRLGDYGDDFLTAVNKISGASAFQLAGHFSTFLDFVACAMGHATKKGPKGPDDIDKQREELAFKALQVVLSFAPEAGALLGPASIALFVIQNFAFDREVWAYVCDLQTLPGPGKYVRSIYNALKNDAEFMTTAEKSPRWGGINAALVSLEQAFPDVTEKGRGFFWEVAPQNPIEGPRVVGLLKQQYGFDHRAAVMIAGAEEKKE